LFIDLFYFINIYKILGLTKETRVWGRGGRDVIGRGMQELYIKSSNVFILFYYLTM